MDRETLRKAAEKAELCRQLLKKSAVYAILSLNICFAEEL